MRVCITKRKNKQPLDRTGGPRNSRTTFSDEARFDFAGYLSVVWGSRGVWFFVYSEKGDCVDYFWIVSLIIRGPLVAGITRYIHWGCSMKSFVRL